MKTFEVRSAFFIRDDNNAVGGAESNRHRQGSIFVKAARKSDALTTLESYGYTVRPAECRLGMGLNMEALLSAGVITDDTLTLVALNGRQVGKVCKKDDERVAEYIGRLENDRTSDVYAYKFVES